MRSPVPTTLDCTILRNLFGSDRMRAVFDSDRMLHRWFDCWVALAEAEAKLGIIPADAAAQIAAAAKREDFDLDKIRRGIADGRHVLYPSVNALAEAAGEAGRYVHWGATTEDIIDTGLILQLRDGLEIMLAELTTLVDALREIAIAHRNTVMAGRTHFQHALPITFGLKVSMWIDQLARDVARIESARSRLLVGQLGGGVGTLAAFGPRGPAVEEEFCRLLGLNMPSAAWYAARDRFGELVSCMGMLAATVERICLEVARLESNDIAEAAEPFSARQVGSSTMPQKRNPVNTSRAAAMCKMVRGLVPVMQGCMVVAHERDISATTAEWLLIPQCMIMMDGALEHASRALVGLVVDPARMRQNLDITKGGIVAEAVMFALASHVGRLRAHEMTLQATRDMAVTGKSLLDVLLDNDDIIALVPPEQLADLVDPSNYVGAAGDIVDRLTARDGSGDRVVA